MHQRETRRRLSSGPLLLTAIAHAELQIYGRREEVLSLAHLHQPGQRVLVLSTAPGARVLAADFVRSLGSAVLLVVPDGNARQAGRAAQRIAGLREAEHVALPPELWGTRLQGGGAYAAWGLDTFAAVSRTLGLLEGFHVAQALEQVAERVHGASALPSGAAEPQRDVEPDLANIEPDVELLYRDNDLVAVNKPSGIAVHRGWSDDATPLLQRVRQQLGVRVYPVHRLDRATSGVVLFALNSEVARKLQTQFSTGQVHKRYLAVCRGHALSEVTVDHPVSDTKGGSRKPAVTHIKLLASFERYGLVEAIPLTGRTHQIRKHLKHIAHPIIGDVRYGKGEHNRYFRQHFGLHRLALHCAELDLLHPCNGEPLCISARPQGELLDLFQRLDWLGSAVQRRQEAKSTMSRAHWSA
jgi:tRNA pseudouridine65 synthase